MGLFDLFQKQKPSTRSDTEWFEVAANLSGTLWTLLHEHPELAANPYARVVLFEDWSVAIFCDKPPPHKILSKGQVSFVFLREDAAAYDNWVKGLRSIPDPFFQKIETETFAKVLVRKLSQTIQVVD
jgi:hypothetical protein